MIDQTKGVVFTAINIDDLADLIATRLQPSLAKTVRENTPDNLITMTEAAKILGIKHLSTIQSYVNDAYLVNYGRGSQRPKLSKVEVVELQKKIVNGRLRP